MVNWSSRKFKETYQNKREQKFSTMLKHLYTYIIVTLQCIIIYSFHEKLYFNNYDEQLCISQKQKSTLKSNYFPTISAMMIANYTSFILYHVQVKPRKKKMLEFVTNSKNPDKQFPKTTHRGSLPTIILLDITITSVISQHSQQIRIVI